MKTEYERWITKVKIEEDKTACWEWQGAKYRKGYGHFRGFKNGKWTMIKAHRFSYTLFNKVSKESIEGLQVCHTCDNPGCVNPYHLFVGTSQDNTNDKVSKGRHCFGNNPSHRLLSFSIAEDVRVCRQKNPKLSYKKIAKIFNTSAQQVCRIIKNQIWKKET